MTDLEKEYGGALTELARDEHLEDRILEDVRVLRTVLTENRDYVKFLLSPNIAIGERLGAIDKAFAAFHPFTRNFIKIMTEQGYAAYLVGCCTEYEAAYNRDHGIVVAEVCSAVQLTKDQQTRLQASLEKRSGKKVELHCSVDPSLLGGLKVTLDGELLEGSVRGKLNTIRSRLSDAELETGTEGAGYGSET